MSWLDVTQVDTAMGAALTADTDDDTMQACCNAARSFVEEKRGDLWAADPVDPLVQVYTPTPAVIHGAAMYAYRLYHRRNNPLGILGTTDVGPAGILREDPDIARLLGIGRSRGFRFGGAAAPPVSSVL